MGDDLITRDRRFMDVALALGRRGLGQTWPNPAVGALLVRETPQGAVIVGRGWTQPGGRPHAETEALRQAGEAARGATLYVTLEPCSHHGRTPPCTAALVTATIARVVSAIEDPDPRVAGRGHALLRAAGIAVALGEGAAQARRDHAGHLRRMREGRPHVTLKLAVSRDGKVGLAGRRPAAITGEPARARVHLLRAMNDALITGIGTVLGDDPLLTCRLPGMAQRSPVRVVLDTHLRTPPEGRLAASAGSGPIWIIAGPDAPQEKARLLEGRGVDVLRAPLAGGRVDAVAALRRLAERGITRVMLEAGPILATSMLDADLVDEAVVFSSPSLLGGTGLDALNGRSIAELTQSPRLTRCMSEPVGADTMTVYQRVAATCSRE